MKENWIKRWKDFVSPDMWEKSANLNWPPDSINFASTDTILVAQLGMNDTCIHVDCINRMMFFITYWLNQVLMEFVLLYILALKSFV